MSIDPVSYLLNPIVDAWEKAETLTKASFVAGNTLLAIRAIRWANEPPKPPAPQPRPLDEHRPTPPVEPRPTQPLPPYRSSLSPSSAPPELPRPPNVRLGEIVKERLGKEISGRSQPEKTNSTLRLIKELLTIETLCLDEVRVIYGEVDLITSLRSSRAFPSFPLQEGCDPNALAGVKLQLQDMVRGLLPRDIPPRSPPLSSLGSLFQQHVLMERMPEDEEAEKALAMWVALGHVREEERDWVFRIELQIMQELLKLETVNYDELMGLHNRVEEIKGEKDDRYEAKPFELKPGCSVDQFLNEKVRLGLTVESLIRQLPASSGKITPCEVKGPSGHTVSVETQRAIQALSDLLAAKGKVLGTAIDNGDCFFDALRQGLEKVGMTQTVKELREIVKKEVDRAPQTYTALYGRDDLSFDQYQERVGLTCEEAVAAFGAPSWGQLELDGKILAEHFKVNITLYEYVDAPGVPPDEPLLERQQRTSDTHPTVEMAIYPGHFVPVFRKED